MGTVFCGLNVRDWKSNEGKSEKNGLDDCNKTPDVSAADLSFISPVM